MMVMMMMMMMMMMMTSDVGGAADCAPAFSLGRSLPVFPVPDMQAEIGTPPSIAHAAPDAAEVDNAKLTEQQAFAPQLFQVTGTSSWRISLHLPDDVASMKDVELDLGEMELHIKVQGVYTQKLALPPEVRSIPNEKF